MYVLLRCIGQPKEIRYRLKKRRKTRHKEGRLGFLGLLQLTINVTFLVRPLPKLRWTEGDMSIETNLFLVRHGETEFNRQGIVQGRGVNAELNDTGLAQAKALAERMRGMSIDCIYSSPLRRAMQTAECVATALNIQDIPTDADLEEMSWGIFEGHSQSEELSSAFDEMKRRWHVGDHDYGVENGETLTQVQSRGVNAIDRILESEKGKRVLVVAHGRFLRILLATLLSDYGIRRMEELSHTNTGINHLIHSGSDFRAVVLNCTEHLAAVK